jgi:hypothetical protein
LTSRTQMTRTGARCAVLLRKRDVLPRNEAMALGLSPIAVGVLTQLITIKARMARSRIPTLAKLPALVAANCEILGQAAGKTQP